MSRIRYIHAGLIAKDWKKLSEFYIKVFRCKPTGRYLNLTGEWINRLTAIDKVKIIGTHISLPGCENGETLEILEYKPGSFRNKTAQINNQGFSHIAFEVTELNDVLQKVIEYGGSQLGAVIENDYEGIGLLTLVFAKDPEGNIVEIQSWKE